MMSLEQNFHPSPITEFLLKLLIQNVGLKLYSLRDEAMNAEREWKAITDFRTKADTEIENLIIEKLITAFPDVEIYGEETGLQGSSNSNIKVVIDPIDGTIPFFTGMGQYTIAIAVLENGTPKSSLIHLPETQETFVAEVGNGAWNIDRYGNKTRLHTSSETLLPHSIVAIDHGKELRQEVAPIMKALLDKQNGVNCAPQLLCASYTMACIASGRIHGFISPSCPPDDALPGFILAKEAGALVSSLDISKPWSETNRSILVACNQSIRDAIVELLKNESDPPFHPI